MSFVLCVFGTVIFLLEGSIKRSTADPRKEKKRVQRDKNGNANNVVFYAILVLPPQMQFLLKSQNTKVTTHDSKYLIQNTMSHIGFRRFVSFEGKRCTPYNRCYTGFEITAPTCLTKKKMHVNSLSVYQI